MALPNPNYVRWGDFPLRFPVAAGTSVDFQMGDFLYWDGTQLKPVADHAAPGDTSDVTARQIIVPKVVGVAMGNRNRYDEFTGEQLVNTFGVHTFSIASGTYAQGQLVGIKGDGNGILLNQTVVTVTDPRQAIGFITRDYSSAVTSVEVCVISAFSPFGSLAERLRTLSLWIPKALYETTNGKVIENYSFGKRIKIVGGMVVVAGATATAATRFTFTTSSGALTFGANAYFDVPVSLAAGAVTTFNVSGANDANSYMDADDTLTILCDTLGGAGTVVDGANLVIYYAEMPQFA